MSKDLEIKPDIESLLGRLNETKTHSLYKPQATALTAPENKSMMEAMSNPIVELVMLFDRSASMSSYKDLAVRGYNKFLDEQKKLGNAKYTLVYFDQVQHMEYASKFIKVVDQLVNIPFDHRTHDGTAIDDAICVTIKAMRDKLSARGTLDSQKVIMAILTDISGDNCSKRYNRQDVAIMIKEMQARFGWEFIWVGLDGDTEEVAKLYGVKPKQTIAASNIGMFEGIKQMSAMITDARGENESTDG